MDYWKSALSGLITMFIMYLLARAGKKPVARDGDMRVLRYGIGFQVFAALLVPGAAFVAYAAYHASSDQLIIAACIALAFVVAALFFSYQAFFVQLSYDDGYIYYSSPLSGAHSIEWQEVREVSYSSLLQCHYIRTPQVKRIWCSNMLRGHEEFGNFLKMKMSQAVWKNDIYDLVKKHEINLDDFINWQIEYGTENEFLNFARETGRVQDVFKYAAILYPRFLLVEDQVVLADHYSEENWKAWRAKLEPIDAANIVNHVHVDDFLSGDFQGMQQLEDGLGELLAFFWQLAVNHQFPENRVSVEYNGDVIHILNLQSDDW